MADAPAGTSFLMVRVPPDLRAEAQAYAAREQRSLSNTMRFALGRLLEEDKRQRVNAVA